MKSIDELLAKASRGQPVDESEFPPIVHIPPPPEPPQKSFRPNPPDPKNTVLEALIKRQDEYKHAAIEQRSKNIELAKGLMTVIKTFDEVIREVRAGAPFDINDLPPPASEFKLSDLEGNEEEPEAQEVPEKPAATGSLGEELALRLAFYSDSAAKATAEGNAGKVRRLNRVVQQYQEAIVAFKKRQPFAFDELPPPPGRPPLANQSVAAVANVGIAGHGRPPIAAPAPATARSPSKTTKLLTERQAAFKAAAIKAKQDGDLPLAKELLRNAMSLDKMLQAVESGRPVDLSQLPSLPTEPAGSFSGPLFSQATVIATDAATITGSRESVLQQLNAALLEQIATCQRYASAVALAGDVIAGKRFEELARLCEKDVLMLRAVAASPAAPVPRFHFELRSFSLVQANPSLAETELSVEIVRATSLALPPGYTSADQFDTYVVLELPFPADATQTATSETVRRSVNPEYRSTHKFQVNLRSRVFQRVMRTKPLRAELYYRKGFLQKDRLYGSSSIKLDRLETCCTLHDSFDLVEGRKIVAGKLELKVSVRTPVGGQQHLVVKEKWLVMDTGDGGVVVAMAAAGPLPGDSSAPASIDVAKYEIGEMRRKLAGGGAQVTPALAAAVGQQVAQKEALVRRLEDQLRSADPVARRAYLQAIAKLPQHYNDEALRLLGENKRDKAQVAMTKKKLVEREIDQLSRDSKRQL